MKSIIEAHNTPSIYHFPQLVGVQLRHYANAPFITYNGQMIPAGNPNSPNSWFLPVDCEVQGGSTLLIPSHEIDTTEDSPTDRTATYTSWLFANGERLGNIPYLAGYGIPELPSHTWSSLTLHRNAKNPPPRQGVYDLGQVEYLIELKLGELRMGSETLVGNVALDQDPLDPLFPIAVGANNPLWLALQSGLGLVTAAGKAVMAGGVAPVLSEMALQNSVIICSSMSAGVTGVLRAVNIVDEEGFDVESSNPGDEGDVAWLIYNV